VVSGSSVRPAGLALLTLSLITACSGNQATLNGSATPAAATPTVVATTGAPASLLPEGTATQELIDALRRGGHVIVFRHALTDRSQADAEPIDLQDCGKQRNLNAAGRAQARMLGAELERLGVPYRTVLTSPYCRTRETAGLAFGIYETHGALEQQLSQDPGNTAARLRDLFVATPAAGTNAIYVTHIPNLSSLGIQAIEEGDAIVLLPDGRAFRFLTVVRAGDWLTFQ
jgi:phosphohistidine phosphatase SixA